MHAPRGTSQQDQERLGSGTQCQQLGMPALRTAGHRSGGAICAVSGSCHCLSRTAVRGWDSSQDGRGASPLPALQAL